MGNEVTITAEAKTMREFLHTQSVQKQFQDALPKFVNPERFIRTCYTAMLDNPKLLSCTRESVVGCMIRMAQLGLEPVLGKAWLIPYRNKEKPGKPLEAQFQVGWRGLSELAKRSGKVSKIPARTVFEGDFFDVEQGTVDKITHKPLWKSTTPIFYYCVVFFTAGWDPSFMVFQPEDVEKVRNASKAPNSPAWRGWYEQMAWKSVTKRLLKREDLSIEVNEAIQADDMAMIGAPQFGEHLLVESPSVPTESGLSPAVEAMAKEETVEPPVEVVTPTEPPTTPPPEPPKDPTPEEKLELHNRALIKTFDSRVSKLEVPTVQDLLFASMEKLGMNNLDDVKVYIMEEKLIDSFVSDASGVEPPAEPPVEPPGVLAMRENLRKLGLNPDENLEDEKPRYTFGDDGDIWDHLEGVRVWPQGDPPPAPPPDKGTKEWWLAKLKSVKKTGLKKLVEENLEVLQANQVHPEVMMALAAKWKKLFKVVIFKKGQPLYDASEDVVVPPEPPEPTEPPTEPPPGDDPRAMPEEDLETGFGRSMRDLQVKLVEKFGRTEAKKMYYAVLADYGYDTIHSVGETSHQQKLFLAVGDLLKQDA
jgi:recombination protein RecT